MTKTPCFYPLKQGNLRRWVGSRLRPPPSIFITSCFYWIKFPILSGTHNSTHMEVWAIVSRTRSQISLHEDPGWGKVLFGFVPSWVSRWRSTAVHDTSIIRTSTDVFLTASMVETAFLQELLSIATQAMCDGVLR